MPPFEFFGAGQQDITNPSANSARLYNCYRDDVGDGKTVLRSCLGMASFVTLTGISCRAMERIDGVLYVVHGGRLWSITSGGTSTNIGAIADSVETTISGNRRSSARPNLLPMLTFPAILWHTRGR